jgi:N-acylneuraminate cytidylyltransferase
MGELTFFIPARKGSERAKNKNTREVFGRPLIWWTFDAVAGYVGKNTDNVIVSTDDDAVIEIAKPFNFQIKKRPAELCQSISRMSDVLSYHTPHFGCDDVCVLYPTSPLRTTSHIKGAIAVWEAMGGKDMSLMSVSPVYHRPYGLMKCGSDGILHLNQTCGLDFYQAQMMPVDYRANGAIYIIPASMIRDGKINSQLFCEKTLAFVMDETTGFEVDMEDDLVVAEALIKNRIFNIADRIGTV